MTRKRSKPGNQGKLGREMDRLLDGHQLTTVAEAIDVPYGTLDGWKERDALPDTARARKIWKAFEAECERLREADDVNFQPQVIKSPHPNELKRIESYIARLVDIESSARELREELVIFRRERIAADKKPNRSTG